MIDASRFSQPTRPEGFPEGTKASFRFGCGGGSEAAAELRKFADAVERGDILLQSVQYGLAAKQSEFCLQALYLEFAEKHVTAEGQ